MDITVKVNFPTDENGLVGRECPKCDKYFKVKNGTGLSTSNCICPYCEYSADSSQFRTKEQEQYIKSVAAREAFGYVRREFEKIFKNSNYSNGNGLIRITYSSKNISVPLKSYQEKELETLVTCDSCGLVFAIYGVFGNCPDCGKLNALLMFMKSIEVAHKRLRLIDSLDSSNDEMKCALLEDALSGGVSAFDAFGKVLWAKYMGCSSCKVKNLFQNLELLSKELVSICDKSLMNIIGQDDLHVLTKMFQLRHVFEHNMGVIDDCFIKKVPELSHLHGRKYLLKKEEIEGFLNVLSKASPLIYEAIRSK
ncbi:MAG: hypothetical protein WC890_04330 [Candidatus Margulisiibacteriota bacterium]